MLIVSGSCGGSEGGDAIAGAPAAPAGSATKGAGGGFSAELSKEIGGSGGSSAGSDAAKVATTGGGSATSGDATKVAAAGSDATKAATAGSSAPASAPTSAPSKASGSAATATAVADPGKSSKSTQPAFHEPVKAPADVAAIKLSLLPNWDRDIDEAGTFQYVVRIKGTQSTKTFRFHYGYDDPKAPNDRDQYKKFLQDSGIMAGEIKDRQRGSAWFLEGVDPSGNPVFRYVVLYGGKHLVCYGSLYKDADANRLGDDRDQTVIQAKQICETLAL